MLRKLQNQIHDYLQQENTQTKEQSEEGFTTILYGEANKVARKQNLEMDAQYSINQSRIIYQQERNKNGQINHILVVLGICNFSHYFHVFFITWAKICHYYVEI